MTPAATQAALTAAAFSIYNAGIRRAVRAYAADQAVAVGLCAACHWRRKSGRRQRRCGPCAYAGYREGTQW